MFDERGFIARFEASDVEEMIGLLDRPSAEEEQALIAHLGDALYQRMHGMALRCRIQRERERPRSNVVVIPGFLGSELALNTQAEPADERLWLNLPRIMDGALEKLRLSQNGLQGVQSADDVEPRGLVKRQYGELLLSLSRHWNVRGFDYDWRKDIEQSAGNLLARINGWFGVDAPVHIVAHGMGGLIARSLLRDHRMRWRSMQSKGNRSGGRLVMLGSANHGSFLALKAITGMADLIQGLTLIDAQHDVTDILKIVHSFVSIYQSLPHPLVDKKLAALYHPETYGELHVSSTHLNRAREIQAHLAEAVDVERMVQVLGYGYRTTTGITGIENVTEEGGYQMTPRGDGSVALDLARLRYATGKLAPIPSYYLKIDHAGLVSSPKILAALDDLLETGQCTGLEEFMPEDLDQMEDPSASDSALAESRILAQIRDAALQLHTRGTSAPIIKITREERVLSEGLMRGLTVPVAMAPRRARPTTTIAVPEIELGLVCGRIASLDYDAYLASSGRYPIDAIAIGHYIGEKPHGQELELDEAISRAQLARLGIKKAELDESDLLLTQYAERGIIRSELGQPFFLDDPRVKPPGKRLIVIAGMGLPGRFGVPELSVLVRELVWSVGRLGNRHLCASQIGTKNSNLSIDDAILGWVRGIKAAITGADQSEQRHLTKITFVAVDPRKVPDFERAILNEKKKMKERDRLKILYEPLSEKRLREFREQALEREHEEFHALLERGRTDRQSRPATPTRITLGMDRKLLRYGALTEDASIPENAVPVDPELVEQANNELAGEFDPEMQLERGRFLERLIIPAELRQMMSSEAPLVMMLDSSSARIHWEMMATTDPVRSVESSQANRPVAGDSFGTFEFGSYFLGTSRGLTRQLRTAFAPPPEPPPPQRRILRVLVVADPAEDARLPGAEAEGLEIADLFETFNTVFAATDTNHVDVVRLLGPREATRTNVLRELMIRSYDVLHFAGHCVYNQDDPKESGWIFSKGKQLSARELTRIDRVPKFIFSNACESGITPDRSDQRNAALAPTFAESFFERGVSNFVCTAWPVSDSAARLFALNLYARLLGLRRPDGEPDRYVPEKPAVMVDAMRDARLAIAQVDGGVRTWGAYQHYGNPFFRLFAIPRDQEAPAAATDSHDGHTTRARQGKPRTRKQPTK